MSGAVGHRLTPWVWSQAGQPSPALSSTCPRASGIEPLSLPKPEQEAWPETKLVPDRVQPAQRASGSHGLQQSCTVELVILRARLTLPARPGPQLGCTTASLVCSFNDFVFIGDFA